LALLDALAVGASRPLLGEIGLGLGGHNCLLPPTVDRTLAGG
jgi:hypothetical protein